MNYCKTVVCMHILGKTNKSIFSHICEVILSFGCSVQTPHPVFIRECKQIFLGSLSGFQPLRERERGGGYENPLSNPENVM